MQQYFIFAAKALIVFFALIGLLFTGVFLAMQFGLLNVRGSINERNQFFFGSAATVDTPSEPCVEAATKTCLWNNTPEWHVVKGGLIKDTDIILRVSKETGVPARLIASVVVPEQTRFFTANREIFKRYFEPLKILGSLSQFSLGVSGIKEETARAIETHAKDTTSPFYPGEGVAALIAYASTTDQKTELYNRLTDPKNHYYSYLYTALYIKEISAQWSRAGYDITNRGDIVATLFNIGFQGSKPNPTPSAGGAGITTGGATYTYGTLGGLFYTSDELLDIFPR